MTIQTWLKLLGMLTAASAITPLGLLHLHPLQRWYNSLHMDPRLHRWVRVRVTHKCLVHLRWWRDSTFSSVPVRREVITTDASLHGWGRWGRRGTVIPLKPSVERAAHQCPRTPDCLLGAEALFGLSQPSIFETLQNARAPSTRMVY